jgi:hypothetical protein
LINARSISILAGLFLLAVGTFLSGMWTTHKNWWAWRTVDEARGLWQSYRATGQFLRENTFVRRQPGTSDAVYAVGDTALLAKGYVVINRFDPATQRSLVELRDPAGAVLHTWPIDYARLVKDGPVDEFPHPVIVLPDGSLMVNFDGARALARIDACGDPMWVRHDMVYHHTISQGADGYWTLADPAWSGGHNQFLVRFDPETGETRESISLLDDILPATPDAGTALTITAGYKVTREADPEVTNDILHPNDVEELSAAMAPAFPQFSAGDLLISLRNINLVAVIDRTTHAILWAQYGPWRDQHDPDFQPDGTITVLSNNRDRNRSTIIAIDPKTNEWRDIFLGTDLMFSSYIMGNHQHLANGNWLIASSMEGRVLEVTVDGLVVREFSNIIDEGYNSVLGAAEFLPEGYLNALPACQR